MTTTAVTIVDNNVVSGGNVIDDGGSSVIARGICYGSIPYPDLSSTFTHTENGTGTGIFTSVIDASVSGTIYVRAYATNASGTAYGDQVTVNIDYLRLPRFVYNGTTYVVAPDPHAYNEYISSTSAYNYCNNLTAYGYSDWRMPTYEELDMMYQYREAIGGFVSGSTVLNGWTHYVLYHCNYNNNNGGHAIEWWSGNHSWASYINNGYFCDSNGHIYYRTHVRPIRVEIVLPTVTTNSVFNITSTTAKCGISVTNEGGTLVLERGVCWNTNPNPTTYNSHTFSSGSGTGNSTYNMTGLTSGTQYYVRAYATNSVGTAYGNELSFTTTSPPTVTTNNVTNIAPNSATCGGNVTAEGSGLVTARGVCWSTNPSPIISNSHTNDGTGTGSFTSNITGLEQGTSYYVRAYATNSEGTAYGEEMYFTTTRWLDVTTNNVTCITQTSATCGGYITAYNGTAVTDRGVCWSITSQTPTVSDSHTSSGTGSGSFTCNLTGLTQNTTYYVRAYATCSGGTVYGETKQFTTTKFEYRISEGGVVATSAGGYFYDSGGPNNNYGNNEHYIMTFMSNQGAGTKIRMTFVEFGTWDSDDYLVIYDGINTSAPLIGTYYDWDSPGTVTATNSDGALTFVFISNSDYSTFYGWKADISIVTPSYFIDVSANPGNGGTVSGGGYFNYGESCTLTASPATGYNFVRWTKNGTQVSTNPNCSFTVTESANYVAHFSQNGYTIMASANPSAGGIVSGAGSFNYGALCTLTATANNGYTFTNWTENGNVVSTNANYSFTVTGNRNLVANFVEVGGDNCAIVFDLMDSYGDGWNGASLNVSFSDGTPSQELTFTSGYNASYVIEVGDGVYITLSWTQGSWDSECSFRVRYEIGPQIYQYSYPSSNFTYVFQMDCSCSNNPIPFADANTKVLCVANWDSNGDGELSYAEAAVVTNLGEVFTSNSAITYFNELQYFTGLTTIGSNEFYGCSGLISVSIPDSATSIGSNAFNGCSNLISVNIPISVTSILGSAFAGCSSLTSITLPIYLVSIGNNAFFGCTSLTSIIIPRYVSSLGSEVFRDCPSLAQISVNGNNTVYDSRNNCKAIIKTATNELVYGCKNTVIPNTVTSIGGAFDGCSSLTSIEIPSSVISIGNYAFYNCTALNTMTIMANNPPTLGSGVFTNVNKSIPVYIPCDAIEAYQENTGWNEFTNFIELCTYEITATANPVEGGNVTGVGIYNQGTTCTLTAMANTGYTFVNWTKNGTQVSTNSIYSFLVTESASYIANFSANSSSSPAFQVNAQYYPTSNDPNSEYVKVYWGEIVTTGIFESFETGDFSLYDWQMDSSNPWSITTINPYEGVYCMKSGGSGVGYVISNMTVTVDIPADGIMSFFGKISCEYGWDYGYFYIDGVQKGSYTGQSSWGEKTFDITAGIHTFQWRYTKDGSVNSNDDCFYVDYVNFNRNAQPGWRTYSGEFNNAMGSNENNTVSWAYEYPVSYLYTNYVGWQITKVSLFSDNQYSAVGGNYTCRIYVGGTEPATGTLVSSLTVDVPSNQNAWVAWDLTTPVNVTGNDPIWVVWTANSTVSNWPAGCSSGSNNYGNWWNAGDGNGWIHSSNNVWTMKQWFTNRPFEYFSVYRANCDGSSSMIIANNVTGDEYIDTGWLSLAAGNYKYGISTSTDGNTNIFWSNCIMKPVSYQIIASANPTAGGNVIGSGTYAQGTFCTLTAMANDGYQFVNWTENDAVVSTEETYSFTVVASRQLVAHFEENNVTQITELLQGWNWWSTYIEQNSPDGLTMMENSLGESGLTIKSQYAFVEYSGQTGTWMGGLASIDNASGYKVMVSEDCASVMSGDMAAAENHPTTLIPGWTWTGYPVTVAQTVTSALSDFEPVSGDIIKGQDAYASYSADLGWTPDNFMLNPGECYMYYSNATEVRNLVFSQGRGEVLQTSHEELYWKTDRHAYPNNLTMMATMIIDGEEQRGEDIELGAFVNGECRGSAKLYYVEPLDRYIAFLTVTGQDDEEVGFKLMNLVRDVTFTSEDHITFRNNAIVGNLDRPFTVHFGAMNGLAEMNTDMYIYPNPIDRNAPFTLVIPEEEIITEVLVVNAMGEVVSHKSGSITRTLHGLSTAGVYLVKVTCKSGRVYQNRLIVK